MSLYLHLIDVSPEVSVKLMQYIHCPDDMVRSGTAKTTYIGPSGCANGYVADIDSTILITSERYDKIISQFCCDASEALRQNSMLRPLRVGVNVDGYDVEEYSVDQAFFELKKSFRYQVHDGQIDKIEMPVHGLKFSALNRNADLRVHGPITVREDIVIPDPVDYTEQASDDDYQCGD